MARGSTVVNALASTAKKKLRVASSDQPGGTHDNPYFLKSSTDLASLNPGEWYVDPKDSSVKQAGQTASHSSTATSRSSTAPDYSKWTFEPLDPQTGKIVPQANIETDPGRILPLSVVQSLPQFRGFGQPATIETDPGRVLPLSVVQSLPQFRPAAAAQFEAPRPAPPDLLHQDEHTFATLTANRAMEDLRGQGATPLVEDYKKVYQSALDKSLDFQKTIQQQAIQQQQEFQKQTALQKSQSALELQRTQQLAQEAEQRQLQEKTWESLGKPVGPQGQPSMAPGSRPTQALPDGVLEKALGYINGINAIQQIGKSHQAMLDGTWGGSLGGVGGRTILGPLGSASSPSMIQFNADVDNNLVPLAKGLQGDTGATAGKDVIRASLHDSLPNPLDNQQVAQGKVYGVTKQTLDNLASLRDLYKGHYDTSALDTAIENTQKTLINSANFAPAAYKNTDPNAVVQSGISLPGQVTVNNQLNTAAAGGVTPAPTSAQTPGAQAVQAGADAGAKAGAVAAGATAGAQAGAQAGAAASQGASSNTQPMQPVTAQSVGNQAIDPNKLYLSGSD
jgi:hypothetical protein